MLKIHKPMKEVLVFKFAIISCLTILSFDIPVVLDILRLPLAPFFMLNPSDHSGDSLFLRV
jgi:hypothetical protein